MIEEALGVIASQRGNKIFLQGDDKVVEKAEKVVHDIRSISAEGYNLKPEDIRYALRSTQSEGEYISVKDLFLNNIPVSSKKRFIIPKTETQGQYVDAIRKHDIVIGIGPAGTGKTYLAMAMAITRFSKSRSAGSCLRGRLWKREKSSAFLPGDISEKFNPYLRPLYDALLDMMRRRKRPPNSSSGGSSR